VLEITSRAYADGARGRFSALVWRSAIACFCRINEGVRWAFVFVPRLGRGQAEGAKGEHAGRAGGIYGDTRASFPGLEITRGILHLEAERQVLGAFAALGYSHFWRTIKPILASFSAVPRHDRRQNGGAAEDFLRYFVSSYW
jgi:hypothetical protein